MQIGTYVTITYIIFKAAFFWMFRKCLYFVKYQAKHKGSLEQLKKSGAAINVYTFYMVNSLLATLFYVHNINYHDKQRHMCIRNRALAKCDENRIDVYRSMTFSLS